MQYLKYNINVVGKDTFIESDDFNEFVSLFALPVFINEAEKSRYTIYENRVFYSD